MMPPVAPRLEPVGQTHCNYHVAGVCTNSDALIFVHGIYGGEDTFKNTQTQFDWPSELPRSINGRQIDVFKLMYHSRLVGWARGENTSFDELALEIMATLKPLRRAGYNSIGFIAHSLGGNIISTYIHSLKTTFGHPQRSQNAFVITLATPVLGAQIADIYSTLKSALGMSDPLLQSLKADNLYLKMLSQFRELEGVPQQNYRCRPVHLHAAVEQKHLGPLLIVNPESAVLPLSRLVNSPIVGFPLDHLAIAKPENSDSAVYRWALERIADEYKRISEWDEGHKGNPARRLCELIDFIAERDDC
jgi:hypothetical protein